MLRDVVMIMCIAAQLAIIEACQPARSDIAQCPDEYTVGVHHLPDRLDPRTNLVTVDHYINLQLYYPLLSHNQGQDYQSSFLDMSATGADDGSLRKFSFCLLKGVAFSNGELISPADLLESIVQTHAAEDTLETNVHAAIDEDCVRVELVRPDTKYFEKFAGVGSTVLKKSSGNEVAPVGLGPYRVASWQNDEVVLRHYSGAGVDFEQIRFVVVKTIQEGADQGIVDLNLLYGDPSVALGPNRVFPVHSAPLKSYALIVSIPNEKVRKCIVKGIDVKKFFDEMLPFAIDNTQGLLANGVLGCNVSFSHVRDAMPTDFCNSLPTSPKIPFYNFFSDSVGKLPGLLEGNPVLKELLEPLDLPQRDVINRAMSGEQGVFLAGLDSQGSGAAQLGEPSHFFEGFYRASRYIKNSDTSLQAMVSAALLTKNRGEKEALYERAHRALLETGYVIPLGQRAPVSYYPRYLKRVVLADINAGHPAIEKIRCNITKNRNREK